MFQKRCVAGLSLLLVAALCAVPPLRGQQADDAETIAKLKVELAQARGDLRRLEAESKFLLKVIAEREKQVLALQAEVVKHRMAALDAELQARTMTERNEELLRQVAKLQEKLRPFQKENAANPPPGKVKGRVDQVDPNDPTLVKINLGADHGIAKNHTLEVYRLTQPTYLGQVRIIDAGPTSSVGRMIVPPGGKRPDVREGDLVASSLTLDK